MESLELRSPDEMVLAMCRKYSPDPSHSFHVAALAESLFELLHPLHLLAQKEARLLRHAAMLHDVGRFIQQRRHQKHSAYLIRHDNALSGYPQSDRELLALMVRNHRKRPAAPPEMLTRSEARAVMQLSAILRLADGLDHDHSHRTQIHGGSIDATTIWIELSGINRDQKSEMLRDKAALIWPAFSRHLSWSNQYP